MARNTRRVTQTHGGTENIIDIIDGYGSPKIVDINVPEGNEEAVISIDTSTKEFQNGARYTTHYYVICDLTKSEKAFPWVKRLRIGSGIRGIALKNETFPNVREVISESKDFLSGSMLVEKRVGANTLLNAFCRREDETVDLKGVVKIEKGAFDGCKAKNVIHADRLGRNYSSYLNGLSSANESGVSVAGTVLTCAECDGGELRLPDGLTHISDSAFSKMNAEKIVISDIKTLEALCGVIRFPESVKELDIEATSDKLVPLCISLFTSRRTNITRVSMHEDVPSFKAVDGAIYTKDGSGFVFCPPGREGEIKVAEGTRSICEHAFVSAKIEKVCLPSTLKVIQREAFSECKALREIEIPGSVTVIDENAFSDCGLRDVTVHEGCQAIEDKAFSGNPIQEIRLPKSLLSIGKGQLFQANKVTVNGTAPIYGLLDAILDPSESPTERLVRVSLEGFEFMFPTCIDRSATSGGTKYDLFRDIWNRGALDKKAAASAYCFAKTPDTKQDAALETLKANPGHKESMAYLRKVAWRMAERFMRDGNSGKFAELIALDAISADKLKSLADLAERLDRPTEKAYIMDAMDRAEGKNKSFRL